MGHDHHFLSRLDRVSTSQVEFALSLYRDADLVRHVLDCARVAAGTERVAIALTDAPGGPHIIVTRGGHFVTCLGAGMSPRPHPVIQRAQLDALASRFGTLRTRLASARDAAVTRREVERLMHSVCSVGPYLSREEFTVLAALQPLLDRTFVGLYLQTWADMARATPHVARLRDLGAARWSTRQLELLEAYWRMSWANGHLLTLAALSGGEVIDDALRTQLCDLRTTVTTGLTLQGQLPLLLRGAWCAARFGTALLANYRACYATTQHPLRAMDAGLALCALGMRDRRVDAEIGRTLTVPRPPLADVDDRAASVATARELVAQHYAEARATPERVERRHRAAGAWLWASMVLDPAEADAIASDDELIARAPEALARALPLSHAVSLVEQPFAIVDGLACAPWLARARAEETYLPRDFIAQIRRRWTPQDTFRMLPNVRPAPGPVRRDPTPGRNEACDCGSGRKFKRCCGGGGARVAA